jgi:hypothetical protein
MTLLKIKKEILKMNNEVKQLSVNELKPGMKVVYVEKSYDEKIHRYLEYVYTGVVSKSGKKVEGSRVKLISRSTHVLAWYEATDELVLELETQSKSKNKETIMDSKIAKKEWEKEQEEKWEAKRKEKYEILSQIDTCGW